MLNVLLSRYYINNVNRSISQSQTRDKVQAILASAKIGEIPAGVDAPGQRGKHTHQALQGELQGIWARHLGKEKEQRDCQGNPCKYN